MIASLSIRAASSYRRNVLPKNTIFENSYRILGLVGNGSVGCVYKAQQFTPDRLVALKVMHEYVAMDPDNLKRFHREVKSLALLRHPNIVKIYRYGVTKEGVPYFSTEFLDGVSLASLLNRESTVSVQRALNIIYQVLCGISFAHELGLYHRDLKPAKIILVNSTSPETVKILDFGSAKFRTPMIMFATANENLTHTGMVMGSINYMSPEQAQGLPVDHRADLYSCGQILFEMLTGSKPRPVLEVLFERERKPILNDENSTSLPPELESILKRALARECRDRYQSAKEFMRDIAKIAPECAVSPNEHFREPNADLARERKILLPSIQAEESLMAFPITRTILQDKKLLVCLLVSSFHGILLALILQSQPVFYAGGIILTVAVYYGLMRRSDLVILVITAELLIVLVVFSLLYINGIHLI